MLYKIVRGYQNSYKRRTIASGLTLEEAKEWCKDPESSSTTCQKPENRRRTKAKGPWFDGFAEDR